VYLDPRKAGSYIYGDIKFDFEPFYIGMGKNYRLYDHLKEAMYKSFITKGNQHKYNKIREILALKQTPIILKIKDLITLEEAISQEIKLIDLIGRNDIGRGPLTNLTNGGELGPDLTGEKNPMYGKRGKNHPASHWKRTEEHLKNQSISHKGDKNSQYGKKWSEERKKQFSEFQKNRVANIPPEQRSKVVHTIENKIKMSKNFSGGGNPIAKKWKIISPTNEVYNIKGTLRLFCKEHNLAYDSLRDSDKLKNPVTYGKSKGWMAIETA
jgi:hypothetical protein